MSSTDPSGSRQGQVKQMFPGAQGHMSKVLKRRSTSDPVPSVPESSPSVGGRGSPQAPSTTIPAAPALARANLFAQSSGKASAKPLTIAAKSYKLQEEKARAVFAKYGLFLEPREWARPGRTECERIEKAVRIRVHRQCHRCQTTYGSEKVCMQCDHTRCKKCPRSPVRGFRDSQVEPRGSMTASMPVAATPKAPRKSYANPLILPSKKSGCDLVRKAPQHRVRRICHGCNSMFIGKAAECAVCHHVRCTSCPRDPYVSLSSFSLKPISNKFSKREKQKMASRLS